MKERSKYVVDSEQTTPIQWYFYPCTTGFIIQKISDRYFVAKNSSSSPLIHFLKVWVSKSPL